MRIRAIGALIGSAALMTVTLGAVPAEAKSQPVHDPNKIGHGGPKPRPVHDPN